MSVQYIKYLIFVAISLVIIGGMYIYINSQSAGTGSNDPMPPGSNVTFKVVFENFRKTSFDSPSELYSAIQTVNDKLEAEKHNLTNYAQDKEDFLASAAINLYPWASSTCNTPEYNWQNIEPCLKISTLILKDSDKIKKDLVDSVKQYKTALDLYFKFEKYKRDKAKVLGGQFFQTQLDAYKNLYEEIQLNNLLSSNTYITTEYNSWEVDFETWHQLDNMLQESILPQNPSQIMINNKLGKFNTYCDMVSNNNSYSPYAYYKLEICKAKDVLFKILENMVEND
jgi:hypothetical protein